MQPSVAPPTGDVWYGWAGMLTDTASVLVAWRGAEAHLSELLYVAAASFVLVPPMVHFAHRNTREGIISLSSGWSPG